MDPTSIWTDLFKISPLIAFMGAAIWYFFTENKQLKLDKDNLQKDKLDLTKSSIELHNVVNRHIEVNNDMLKNIPVLFATMQAEIVKTIKEGR